MSISGEVKCWGQNNFGQLGYGDTADRGDGPGEMGIALPAVDLGPGRTATQIACGDFHTCALLDNAQIKCWGKNTDGQLGYGDSIHRGDDPGEMGAALPEVAIGSVRTAQKVVTGWGFTCVLLDTGNVKCWGINGDGQLGKENTAALNAPPTSSIDLALDNAVVDIAAGTFHVCVLFNTKRVQCWGQNNAGQLGLGDSANRGDGPGEMGTSLPLVALGANHEVEAIEAGSGNTCALLASGDLKCWGLNFDGEIGYGLASSVEQIGDAPGEMGDDLPPVDFGTAPPVESVHLGNSVSCAHFQGGSIKCFGALPSGAGQIPNDSVPFLDLGTGTSVDQMEVTNQHYCTVLTVSGTAGAGTKCWGAGASGRLGTGSTEDILQDTGLGDALPFVDLSDPPTTSPTQDPTPLPTTESPTTVTASPTLLPTTPSPTTATVSPTPLPTTASPTAVTAAPPPHITLTQTQQDIAIGLGVVACIVLVCGGWWWCTKTSVFEIVSVAGV